MAGGGWESKLNICIYIRASFGGGGEEGAKGEYCIRCERYLPEAFYLSTFAHPLLTIFLNEPLYIYIYIYNFVRVV